MGTGFDMATMGAHWREALQGVVAAAELAGARWEAIGHATENGVRVTLADGRRFRLWRDGGHILCERVPS